MRFYPFPQPEIWTDRPQPGGFKDYDSKVASWMIRNGFRYLRETFDLPGLEFPHPADLAAWMIEQAFLRGGEWAKRIDVEERARYAAQEAMRLWDSKVYSRAAKGGTRSRRGPSITIDAVQAKDGLSIAQAAKELGCSTATVKRRRAEVRTGLTTATQTILRGMDRQLAGTSIPDSKPAEDATPTEADHLLALLDAEPEIDVIGMALAEYGFTRASFFAQTPERTYAHEYWEMAA